MQRVRQCCTVIKPQLVNNGDKMKVKNNSNWNRVTTHNAGLKFTQQGFTLIEFMVAAILGLIVLLAIGGAYVSTQKVNEVATSRVTRQQELRMANNLLIRDARMAGSFGCANLSALAGGAGVSVDQGSTKLSENSNGSYFNINDSAGASRVYSAQILASTHGVMTAIANGEFTAKAGSDVVIFNYGINTQPLLTVTNTGTNTLSAFTLSNVNTFTGGQANARVVLASCNRLDIIQKSQLSVTSSTITLNGLTIPMNKTGTVPTIPPSVAEHYAVQATLSNLQTVAYAVGNIKNDTSPSALYRFELLSDGSWSAPQLLAKNVSTINGKFIYVTDCAEAASDVGTEKYKLGTAAFITEGTVAVPPTGIELTLTPTKTDLDANVESNASDNVSTNAADLTPIVLNATMRGANVCANR